MFQVVFVGINHIQIKMGSISLLLTYIALTYTWVLSNYQIHIRDFTRHSKRMSVTRYMKTSLAFSTVSDNYSSFVINSIPRKLINTSIFWHFMECYCLTDFIFPEILQFLSLFVCKLRRIPFLWISTFPNTCITHKKHEFLHR